MPAIMTMLADHAARQLLDFNQKLDINLLDNVVNCLYHGEGAQQRMAQEVLTHLKEHPDAWTRVDTILEFSQNMNTKYYGLQILENVIKTRWKILPRNQCEGIKKYVVGLIIKTSSDPTCVEKEKVYIGKLNMILVQILKQEWPKHWPTFISDIVGASRTSESLCQNNMVILKLLSEEVFDFSSGQITQVKAKHLKDRQNHRIIKVRKELTSAEFREMITSLVLLTILFLTQARMPSAFLATWAVYRHLSWAPIEADFPIRVPLSCNLGPVLLACDPTPGPAHPLSLSASKCNDLESLLPATLV
uniref:Importin N-terminal domain-containing protein n=1 Tax=Pavo cristatus TaxID=9049 RepID=A0A8C9FWD5_PAVCR